jgi:hypothetical protein
MTETGLDMDKRGNNLTQSRLQLHTRRIGHWRQYAAELKPTVTRLRQILAPLKLQEGGLPFMSEVNWNLRLDHPVYAEAEAATTAAEAEAEIEARKAHDRTQGRKSAGADSGLPKWFPQTKFDGRGSRVTSAGLKKAAGGTTTASKGKGTPMDSHSNLINIEL